MMRGRITETLIADLQEMALFPGEGRARREERQAQGPAHQTRRPNTHTTTHREGNDTTHISKDTPAHLFSSSPSYHER
jgi:hypothetical protein